VEGVDGDPAAEEDGGAGGDLDPHHGVGLGRDVTLGEEAVEAAAQDFGEGGNGGGVGCSVLQGGLGRHKILNLWG
jgi:L-aminopeptidase/D-esterase-like protein